MMNGAKLLKKIAPAWQAALPNDTGLMGFIERNRSQIEAMLDEWLEKRRARKAAKARTQERVETPDELTPELDAALAADYGAFVTRFERFLPETGSVEEAANMAAAARQEAMLRSRGWGHHWKNMAAQCQINARSASKRKSKAKGPTRRRAESMPRRGRGKIASYHDLLADKPKLSEIYMLVRVHGNSLTHIAGMLGISPKQAHERLQQAEALLHERQAEARRKKGESLPRSPRGPAAATTAMKMPHFTDAELDGIIDAAIDGAGGDMVPEVSFSVVDYDGETQMRLGELARGAGWLTMEKDGFLTLVNPYFVQATPEEIAEAFADMEASAMISDETLRELEADADVDDLTDEIEGAYLPGDTIVDQVPTFEAAMPRSRRTSTNAARRR